MRAAKVVRAGVVFDAHAHTDIGCGELNITAVHACGSNRCRLGGAAFNVHRFAGHLSKVPVVDRDGEGLKRDITLTFIRSFLYDANHTKFLAFVERDLVILRFFHR